MLMPVPPRWLVLSAILILGVNAAAYWKHLYFFVWWLDIPMHLFSGGLLAAVTLSLIATHPRLAGVRSDHIIAFWFTVGIVMLIGVVWELFEFRIDPLVRFAPHDASDTLSDLLFDLLGAIVGAFLVLKMRYTKCNG